MAFDSKPSSWIASWAEAGGSVSFPLASLSQPLTADEAHATTGDWRDCLYSILDHSYAYFNGLNAVDKPAKVELARTIQKHTESVLKITYTATFYVSIAATDVAAEA